MKNSRHTRLLLSLLPWPLVAPHLDEGRDPEYIIDLIQSARDCRVVTHVAEVHGSDPEAAARGIADACHATGTEIVSYWDPGYPLLLRHIPSPPLVLYIRGNPGQWGRAVSIVGTRKCDSNAARITGRIAGEAAGHDCIVVSGLAAGVDSAAHSGAIEAGGRTIAVLGTAIDRVYPAMNRELARRIVEIPGSAVISEFPPGVTTKQWTFVKRNRIISGLSPVTLITMAGRKSGALGTGKFALEQGRDLYCCTGLAFDARYLGCLGMIRDGATPFISTDDMLEEAGLVDLKKKVKPETPDTDTGTMNTISTAITGAEGKVLQLCGMAPRSLEELSRELHEPVTGIMGLISRLEIKGLVSRRGPLVEVR